MRNKIITCPQDVLVVSIEIGNKVKFRYKKSQQRKRKLVWKKKNSNQQRFTFLL
jgi:hypothetical protein